MSTGILNCNQIFQTRNTSHNKAKAYAGFQDVVQLLRGFPGGASGKEPRLPMQETLVRFLGREDPLGKG